MSFQKKFDDDDNNSNKDTTNNNNNNNDNNENIQMLFGLVDRTRFYEFLLCSTIASVIKRRNEVLR